MANRIPAELEGRIRIGPVPAFKRLAAQAVGAPTRQEGCASPAHPLETCPATEDEITQPLSFALRFGGKKRAHDADQVMVMPQITVERLVEYLERAGYVVLCKPAADQHGAPGNHAEWVDHAIKLQRGEWDRH